MERITLEDYFGPYWLKGEDTAAMHANAMALLGSVNGALELAIADGVTLFPNPKTGTYVSGEGHGGFRDSACTVGAKASRHRKAMAVDVYDPQRRLATWAIHNKDRLISLGILGMERPEWTPTWCHLQIEWVGSRTWCYIPSSAPALADALPGQAEALA